MLNRFVIAAFFAVAACTPPQPPGQISPADSATQQLYDLFDDEWRSRLPRDPLFASRVGVTNYNRLLPDMSPDAKQRHLDEDVDYLRRLAAIDRAALSEADQVNYDLFEFDIGHRAALAKYRPYRIPFLSDAGFHMEVQRMHDSMPFAALQHYDDYLARLAAIGPYFAQHIANMRDGLAAGFTQPRVILEGIVPSILSGITDNPHDSVFYPPFDNMPQHFAAAERERLKSDAAAVIANVVVPAYREFLAFFRGEYTEGARTTLGASSYTDGKAYYRDLARFFTSLDGVDPDAIHELGLQEVARIRAEMEAIIDAVDFGGTFAEFIDFLRTDPQFYVDDPKQLLKEASYIAKKIDGQMPAFFRTMPRLPYGVQAVPDDIAPNYTTGRYWPAPVGGRRGGYYMVNTFALDKRPLYTMGSLTAHEGAPGHHHQNSLRQEIEGIPEFRRALYPHAFGEGWALYAEKLGVEMGIFETPYDNFGRLTYEMWRAVRLVVDTGIHYRGWTREQARDFLAANTALSLHNVRTEIDRYISWPGQALAFKMGELKILELRARAEKELGEQFDIRDFHDAIMMTGGVPLDLLEQEIERFILKVKSGV